MPDQSPVPVCIARTLSEIREDSGKPPSVKDIRKVFERCNREPPPPISRDKSSDAFKILMGVFEKCPNGVSGDADTSKTKSSNDQDLTSEEQKKTGPVFKSIKDRIEALRNGNIETFKLLGETTTTLTPPLSSKLELTKLAREETLPKELPMAVPPPQQTLVNPAATSTADLPPINKAINDLSGNVDAKNLTQFMSELMHIVVRVYPLDTARSSKVVHHLWKIYNLANLKSENSNPFTWQELQQIRDDFAQASKEAFNWALCLKDDEKKIWEGLRSYFVELKRRYNSLSDAKRADKNAEETVQRLEATIHGITTQPQPNGASIIETKGLTVGVAAEGADTVKVSTTVTIAEKKIIQNDRDGFLQKFKEPFQLLWKFLINFGIGRASVEVGVSLGVQYYKSQDPKTLIKLANSDEADRKFSITSNSPKVRAAFGFLEKIKGVFKLPGKRCENPVAFPRIGSGKKVLKGFDNGNKMLVIARNIDSCIKKLYPNFEIKLADLTQKAVPSIQTLINNNQWSKEPTIIEKFYGPVASAATNVYRDNEQRYVGGSASVSAGLGPDKSDTSQENDVFTATPGLTGRIGGVYSKLPLTKKGVPEHTRMDVGQIGDWKKMLKLYWTLDKTLLGLLHRPDLPRGRMALLRLSSHNLALARDRAMLNYYEKKVRKVFEGGYLVVDNLDETMYGTVDSIPKQFKNSIYASIAEKREKLETIKGICDGLAETYTTFVGMKRAFLDRPDKFIKSSADRNALDQNHDAAFEWICKYIFLTDDYPGGIEAARKNPEEFIIRAYNALSVSLGCAGNHYSVITHEMNANHLLDDKEENKENRKAVLAANESFIKCKERLDKELATIRPKDLSRFSIFKDESESIKRSFDVSVNVSFGSKLSPSSIGFANSVGNHVLNINYNYDDVKNHPGITRVGERRVLTFSCQVATIEAAVINKAIKLIRKKLGMSSDNGSSDMNWDNIRSSLLSAFSGATSGVGISFEWYRPKGTKKFLEQNCKVIKTTAEGLNVTHTVKGMEVGVGVVVGGQATQLTTSTSQRVVHKEGLYELVVNYPSIKKFIDDDAKKTGNSLNPLAQTLKDTEWLKAVCFGDSDMIVDVVDHFLSYWQEPKRKKPDSLHSSFAYFYGDPLRLRAATVLPVVQNSAAGKKGKDGKAALPGPEPKSLVDQLTDKIKKEITSDEIVTFRRELRSKEDANSRSEYYFNNETGKKVVNLFFAIIENLSTISLAAGKAVEEGAGWRIAPNPEGPFRTVIEQLKRKKIRKH